MKKLTWIVPVALVLALLISIFLLPSQPIVYRKITLHAAQDGVAKLLTQKAKWQQWWPALNLDIHYDSGNFSYQQQLLKAAVLQVPVGRTFVNAQLQTILYGSDSCGVIFQTVFPATSNPLKKISHYLESKQLDGKAETILNHLKTFAEKEENIYGFTVRQEKVKDSSFVATRFESFGYPQPEQLYRAIDDLRRYITSQNAKEIGLPILNAQPAGKGQYQVMVALPVNSALKGAGKIQPKRMILGRILVTEIKGGPHTLQKAMQDFEQYLIDHRRTSPAIPFESLITNRLQEQDTSKWITRLYFPVM
ncbi:GyrI-like domain-containing protein [Flavisolibacter sp. BT320]|nr:GyrI-like domain-containing protein [Flavisolibacter longurius]